MVLLCRDLQEKAHAQATRRCEPTWERSTRIQERSGQPTWGRSAGYEHEQWAAAKGDEQCRALGKGPTSTEERAAAKAASDHSC